MKSLSPITIAILGPLLIGVALAGILAFRLPETQAPPGILSLFLIGAAVGAVLFGPIAMAVAARSRLTERTARYARRALRFTSAVALVSGGYLMALLRHDVRDSSTALVLASLLAFLGVLASISLEMVLEPKDAHAAEPSDATTAATPSEGDASDDE